MGVKVVRLSCNVMVISDICGAEGHVGRAFSQLLSRFEKSLLEDLIAVRRCCGISSEEVIKVGLRLAGYVHDNGIKNVMFIDKSARPGYLVLRGGWHATYPNERVPGMYFINPLAIQEGHIRPGAVKSFMRTYPHLFAQRKEPILVFDSCMHSGDKMKKVVALLDSAGFWKIKKGLVQPQRGSQYDEKMQLDFIALDSKSEFGCRPLGTERIVVKGDCFTSERRTMDTPDSYDNSKISDSRALRQQIISIFESLPRRV